MNFWKKPPDSLMIRCLSLPRFLASGLADVVFPPACRFCEGPLMGSSPEQSPGKSTERPEQPEYFCSHCLRELTITEPMMRCVCRGCAIPRSGWVSALDSPTTTCPSCRDHDFDFDAVIPLWMYRDRVCDAIVAAKYASNRPLADALGHRLGNTVAIALADDLPSEVTYVPSHLFRQLSRGGLGNRTIAEAVARRLQIPLRHRLRTHRQIAKQAWLNDEERKQNVCGAFMMRKGYAFSRSPRLDDRHILVVDDVMTTGATAGEVASVLKQSGATRVTVAVVARAIRTF